MPRPSLPQALRNRLPGWWRRPSGNAGGKAGGPAEDPLLAIGRELRRRREERGLNLRQLALETRISTTVLEALERGWRDRLPEGAYLRTMLPLIERHLGLEPRSLEVALPPAAAQAGHHHRQAGLLGRFTPGSIEVFSTWQGTVLYGLISLGLIYAINLQQQRLAASNRLSLEPIQPLPASEQTKPPAAGITLLQAYPELRPLGQAEAGVALGRLRADATGQAPRAGLLELELAEASQLSVSSSGGLRTTLQGASGRLSLPLVPPFQVSVEPAPKAGAVRWNGSPLAAVSGLSGRFQLPPTARTLPAKPPADAGARP